MGRATALVVSPHRLLRFAVVLLVVFLGVGGSRSTQAACGESPIIATDQQDYGPTQTVVITGTGFNCGDALSVLVTAPDGSRRSGSGTGVDGPDIVIADEGGAFTLNYRLSGLLSDGRAYTGQLGTYLIEVRDNADVLLASARFTDAAGPSSCALTAAGGVKCWGVGDFGELGNGTFARSAATPVDVTGLTSGVVQVSVGFFHACALTITGSVKCWGQNIYGQLGNGTLMTTPPYGSATPVDVSGLDRDVAWISAGGAHTCAVTTAGAARCWGNNEHRQLGNGTIALSSTPVEVGGLDSGVAQISAGSAHTCALMTAGGAKCWGINNHGQLGNGTVANSDPLGHHTPTDVSMLTSGVVQISAGLSHTCAVTATGGATCWGGNGQGQLGNGTFADSATPVAVSMPTSRVAQISLGENRTCATSVSGGVQCWGANSGQLADGTVTASPVPVDVPALSSGVVMVSSGWVHTCALTTAGGAKCWGSNGRGELGDGTLVRSDTPVDVSGLMSGVAVLWDAEPITGDPPSTAYEIVSRNSDKCLDVSYGLKGPAAVIQWRCHRGANQRWRLEPAGHGAFRIIAHHSGQVLDVYAGIVADVTPVIQFPWHGGDNQLWTIEPASNGYVFIIARHSGKVLDVTRGSLDDGTQVIQHTRHGGANQQWLLHAVAPAADPLVTASDRRP